LASLADSAQENFQNYYDKYENYFNILFWVETKLNNNFFKVYAMS
jgi:hypothetical protein